jgi:hypothetical protein
MTTDTVTPTKSVVCVRVNDEAATVYDEVVGVGGSLGAYLVAQLQVVPHLIRGPKGWVAYAAPDGERSNERARRLLHALRFAPEQCACAVGTVFVTKRRASGVTPADVEYLTTVATAVAKLDDVGDAPHRPEKKQRVGETAPRPLRKQRPTRLLDDDDARRW